MLALYIGVYKALYDYSAQAEEELSIQTDDLLYLLEKSDLDDWWKVKKRVVAVNDEVVDEPQGLVPCTYIEPAPVVKQCTALYDYDKQTEEEISFKEGDRFNIFDLNDPDWLLVGDLAHSQLGFVPSNYLQIDSNQPASTGNISQPLIPTQNQPIQFAPPPVHKDRIPTPVDNQTNSEKTNSNQKFSNRATIDVGDDNEEEEQEEAPPPMPTRPRGNTLDSAQQQNTSIVPEPELLDKPEHNFDGTFFTWYIDEIDGRKKRPVVFSVGNGLIILKPNAKNKKILSSASTLNNEWKIKDLVNLNHEKKHVFLDLKNPTISVELHAGSKDVAEAIMSILSDLKGAEAAKGLKEVARASKASTNSNNRKIGSLIYDFKAQGSDELSAREGDEVYIINDVKSNDWWMCENIDTGKQGVIPSSYIEIIGTSNLEKLTEGSISRRKSTKSSKGKVVDNKRISGSHGYRSRDERERIREKDRQERDKHHPGRESDSSKSKPNYHRVRTWIDSSGSFKVEAEFLGCVEGKIHLHKTNGVKIAVAANKLCIEDLEYVEKVTGTSLETYKEEVNKQMQKKASRGKSGVVANSPTTAKPGHSATAAINDLSSPKPTKSKPTTQLVVSEPDYDWFEFFLQCGIDIGNCQRYSLKFGREQMDENILEDITPSLLRTLGLREGDILRVMKFLDNKFGRSKTNKEDSAPAGGLFTEATGVLKNNSSTTDVSKVDANALHTPQKEKPQIQSTKLEDDAWVVKPAARSSEDLSKPNQNQNSTQSQAPQYTGSLQDLVNIKPFDPNATSNSNNTANTNKALPEITPNAPVLQPVKTGPSQPVSNVHSQTTGGLIPVQRTAGLIPVNTGGLIPVQPTGFMPIQPTGFMPIQQTGGLQPQLTFNIVPLQTGTTTFTIQRTGGANNTAPPPTTFGQPVLQPGNVTIPQTSFNQVSIQQTGPLVPNQFTGVTGQLTGGLPNQFTQQPTGQFNIGLPQTSFNSAPVSKQVTGGFVPQSTFGKQITGGVLSNQTGGNISQNGFNNVPTTSFGNISSPPTFTGQPTQNMFAANNNQPFIQQQTQNFQTQPFPQQSFNSGFNQQQPQQPDMNSISNMFQNSILGGQNNFNQPQQSFPMNNFNTGFPVNSFNQQQPQQSFPNTFNQQPQPSFPNTFNQAAQPSFSTSFNQQPQQMNTSFNQFEGFGNQPLQSQPTGAGFGNAPLQSQQTGNRKANLLAATPDNPFGF